MENKEKLYHVKGRTVCGEVRILWEDAISWYVEEVGGRTDGYGHSIRNSLKKSSFKLELVKEEVTYSMGEKFVWHSFDFILAYTGANIGNPTVGLVCLFDGTCWNSRTSVRNTRRITQREFNVISDGREFVRSQR